MVNAEIGDKEMGAQGPGCGVGKPFGPEVTTQIFRARAQEAGGLKNVTESSSVWARHAVAVNKYLLNEKPAELTKTPYFQLVVLSVSQKFRNLGNQRSKATSPSEVNGSTSSPTFYRAGG